MRRAGGAWAVVLCVAACGCGWHPFTHAAKPKSNYSVGGFGNAFGNSLAVDEAPGLYVESVLFERTAGDPLINRDIWANDFAALPPQTRVLLEENGLRAAVVGGTLPAPFQKLLETGEGAVSPQVMTFGARTDTVVPTAGPIPTCEFKLQSELSGERESKKLFAANAGFRIVPTHLPDGRVKVRCEPQLQHGERQDFIRPAADGTGFTLQSELPQERYESLGFDVVLGPGEYLVIGWPAADEGDAKDRSLGSAMFCVDGRGETHQRVLVIRAGWRGEQPRTLPELPRSTARPIAAHVAKW